MRQPRRGRATGRRRPAGTAIVAALLGCAAWAGSETLTLIANYPVPLGIYKSVVSAGNAVLARDGGAVAIGKAAAEAKLKLDVAGAAKFGSTVDVASALTAATLESTGPMILRGVGAQPPALDGKVIFNSTTQRLEYSKAGAWFPASFPSVKSTFLINCNRSTTVAIDNPLPSFGAKHTLCQVTGAVGAAYILRPNDLGGWMLSCSWDGTYSNSAVKFPGQTDNGMVEVTCFD
jgi:hypothetical protein